MKNNLFQFDDTFWLEKDGTTMGTPTACLYATISYGIHERNKLLPTFSDMLLLYKRFIDDMLGIWNPSTNAWPQQPNLGGIQNINEKLGETSLGY